MNGKYGFTKGRSNEQTNRIHGRRQRRTRYAEHGAFPPAFERGIRDTLYRHGGRHRKKADGRQGLYYLS